MCVFVALMVFGIVKRRDSLGVLWREHMARSKHLWIGVSVAFILLEIDPTRNNFGVLRYALVPAVFAVGVWTLSLFQLRSFRSIDAVLIALFSISVLIAGTVRATKSYADSDYRGIREADLQSQMQSLCEVMAHADPGGKIRLATNFSNDLNFNNYQWQICAASGNIPKMDFLQIFGSQFYMPDLESQLPVLLSDINYFVLGAPACGDPVPLAEQLKEVHPNIIERVAERCQTEVGKFHYGSCSARVLRCKS
jgi:hypothetical protein